MRKATRSSRASVVGSRGSSERTPILAGAEDPQYTHVSGGFVVSCIGRDLVERTVAAIAGQFPHARVLTGWPEARVLDQALDQSPDPQQPLPRRWSRARLGQPAANSVEVGNRLVGVFQFARQPAAGSAAGVWDGEFIFGPDAVDPGSYLGGTDKLSGGDVGSRLRDPLRFPGKAAFPPGLSLGTRSPTRVDVHHVHSHKIILCLSIGQGFGLAGEINSCRIKPQPPAKQRIDL